MDVEEACGMGIVKVRSGKLKVHRWRVNVRRSMVKVLNLPPKVIIRGLYSIGLHLRVELSSLTFVVLDSIQGL